MNTRNIAHRTKKSKNPAPAPDEQPTESAFARAVHAEQASIRAAFGLADDDDATSVGAAFLDTICSDRGEWDSDAFRALADELELLSTVARSNEDETLARALYRLSCRCAALATMTRRARDARIGAGEVSRG